MNTTAGGAGGSGDGRWGDRGSAATAAAILRRSQWAARVFGDFDADRVRRMVADVVDLAEASAATRAEWTVHETGRGVAEDKCAQNVLHSRGLHLAVAGADFVSPRTHANNGVMEIPRPAGVVVALAPWTNPIAAAYEAIIVALLTRNAVVVHPHPRAWRACVRTVRDLAEAATAAGAPDGSVQVVDQPSTATLRALTEDPPEWVIPPSGFDAGVAPSFGTGDLSADAPRKVVPALVDATADPSLAARRLVDSVVFDESLPPESESVLIADRSIVGDLLDRLRARGSHVLDAGERDRVRALLFPDGRFATEWMGRSALDVAGEAGLRVDPTTRLLVAPIDGIGGEEPLAAALPLPVVSLLAVGSAASGIAAARSVVRNAGGGHHAAIHGRDPATIERFATRVAVGRVAVNRGSNLGSDGASSRARSTTTAGLAPAAPCPPGTVLEPARILRWTRITADADAAASVAEQASRPAVPDTGVRRVRG